MIRCKESVRFAVLRPHIYNHFQAMNQAFQDFGVDCIITCGTEAHGPDDPHTHGFAVDLRSKHLPDSGTKHAVLQALRDILGVLYTVILESEGQNNEHFHIQVRKNLWRSLK